MQAVLRRLPRRAPADRDRQKPLPRRGGSPGAAEGGVPAEPARLRRAVRLHLLHVPGRHGLRRRQRGGRRCHQRHEPARPRWPQRQRGGGRQCGRQRLRQRPGEGRRVPASAGAGRLPRRRRELSCPGGDRRQLSGRARCARAGGSAADLPARCDALRPRQPAAR